GRPARGSTPAGTRRLAWDADVIDVWHTLSLGAAARAGPGLHPWLLTWPGLPGRFPASSSAVSVPWVSAFGASGSLTSGRGRDGGLEFRPCRVRRDGD